MLGVPSGHSWEIGAITGITKEARMHITDTEMGLAMGFASRIRSDARAAQAAVAGRDVEINRLRRLVAKLERENAQLIAERARSNSQRFAAHLARH